MAIAAVAQCRETAVLKCQGRGVRSFCRPVRVPRAGNGPDAAHPPAAEQSHDIGLMRRLIENRPATLRRIKLFGTARPVKIIRVVERRYHSGLTELAAFDKL